MPLPPLQDILDEYEFLDGEDRYRLLIDLGKQLDLMPDALKTDATKVRGCSASVWVYPTVDGDRLHFLAASNAAITKGIVALILSAVQGKPAAEIADMTVPARMICTQAIELSAIVSARKIKIFVFGLFMTGPLTAGCLQSCDVASPLAGQTGSAAIT